MLSLCQQTVACVHIQQSNICIHLELCLGRPADLTAAYKRIKFKALKPKQEAERF